MCRRRGAERMEDGEDVFARRPCLARFPGERRPAAVELEEVADELTEAAGEEPGPAEEEEEEGRTH